MPSKDRLQELQQARNEITDEIKSNKSNSINLREYTNLLKQFEIINKWIEAVEENTRTCETLLCNLNDKHGFKKLENIFKNSETICYNISSKLKQIGDELKLNGEYNVEHRIKYMQHVSVSERFKAALEAHLASVKHHQDVRKEIIQKCNLIINNEYIDDCKVEDLLHSSNTQLFVQDYLKEVQKAHKDLIDAKEQNQQLLIIESHLSEVNELFKQIAFLIEQQHEGINRIEYQALLAIEYVDETVHNLDKAKKSRQRACKRRFYIATALIIIVVTIIILGILF